jgi:hypothetical protein
VRYPTQPDSEDEEEGETSLYFPAWSSHYVFRALCTSVLGDVNTLRLQKDLVVRLRKIPSLSSCRVDDDERFGQLSHWSRLMEHTGAPNLVLFVTDLNQFYVVSAKRELTQHVHTRSALCWLRERAGLGFSYDASGGVFRIQVSRQRCKFDDNRWAEGVARLVDAISIVFPIHVRRALRHACGRRSNLVCTIQSVTKQTRARRLCRSALSQLGRFHARVCVCLRMSSISQLERSRLSVFDCAACERAEGVRCRSRFRRLCPRPLARNVRQRAMRASN